MVGSVLFGTTILTHGGVRPLWDFIILTHGGVRSLWDLLNFNPWWGPSSLGLVKFLTQGGVRPL